MPSCFIHLQIRLFGHFCSSILETKQQSYIFIKYREKLLTNYVIHKAYFISLYDIIFCFILKN